MQQPSLPQRALLTTGAAIALGKSLIGKPQPSLQQYENVAFMGRAPGWGVVFSSVLFLANSAIKKGSGEIISALGLMVTVIMWLEGRFEKMDIKSDTQYANLMAILMQLREDNAERKGLLAVVAAACIKNTPAAAAQPTRETVQLDDRGDNGDDCYAYCMLSHQVAYASKLVEEFPAKIQEVIIVCILKSMMDNLANGADGDRRDEIARIREQSESVDSPAKLEDYVIIRDKYRMVRPYHFDFLCSVKQRWAGQGIVDIFCSEFPALSREYYLHAVATGLLRVEGIPSLTPDTPLIPGDRMRHLVHRHEPPVLASPVSVIAAADDIVAVCKPPGMPVHVAGQYRKNTVLGILGAERPDLGRLLPVHRLDKPVGGVLLFARHKAAAEAVRVAIEGRLVEKVYVARVMGVFPQAKDGDEVIIADVALGWDPVGNMAFPVPDYVDQQIITEPEENVVGENPYGNKYNNKEEEEEPLEEISEEPLGDVRNEDGPPDSKRRRKQGKKKKKEQRKQQPSSISQKLSGRPAITHYRLLGVSSDGATSVVECRPLTGRTHQIRAHLAWLGHPIANDAQYGGVYGGPAAARALAAELGVKWGDKAPVIVQSTGPKLGTEEATQFTSCAEFEAPVGERDVHCLHCPYYSPKDYPIDLRPLWLFARKYAAADWVFEAPPPDWAQAEWVPPPPEVSSMPAAAVISEQKAVAC